MEKIPEKNGRKTRKGSKDSDEEKIEKPKNGEGKIGRKTRKGSKDSDEEKIEKAKSEVEKTPEKFERKTRKSSKDSDEEKIEKAQNSEENPDFDNENLSPSKRVRRAPSRLIEEEEENLEKSPPKTPLKTYSRCSKVEPFDVLLKEIEEDSEREQKIEKPQEKTPKKLKDARYYKPEHTQLLVDLYEKTNKYPTKQEMSEVAKIIGVLPIKILWWFTHRRRQERKKGEDFFKKAKTTPKKPEKIEENIEPVADIKLKKCLLCKNEERFLKTELIKHLKEIHQIKGFSCKVCKFMFKSCQLKNHQCERIPQEIKPQTTPKKDKKPTFYSTRYRNLLQEFSPKKAQQNEDLGEMMQKCVLRNGKLELNYVTPIQLKAVEEFLFGDPKVEKVKIDRITTTTKSRS